MSVLLIAEHNNKEIRPFNLNGITAASQIDQDLHPRYHLMIPVDFLKWI